MQVSGNHLVALALNLAVSREILHPALGPPVDPVPPVKAVAAGQAVDRGQDLALAPVSELFRELDVPLTFNVESARNVLGMFCCALSAAALRIGAGLVFANVFRVKKMVGAVRFELTTSCTRNKRASRATLRPDRRLGGKCPLRRPNAMTILHGVAVHGLRARGRHEGGRDCWRPRTV
jgi:hypothetical protein